MDSNRDVTRVVESWLRTDEHESADRVLDTVLALLDTTPQRRSWWPARRSADMNNYAKLALAAVAVVAVAVIGFSLRPQGSGVGGGGSTVAPSPSALPTPTPGPTNSPIPAAKAGAMEVGTYAFSQNGVDFTLDISQPDWVSNGVQIAPDGINLNKGTGVSKDSAWMLFWSIDGVYADPCGHKPAPPVSPSAADLAAGVASLPGAKLVSGPTDVTVGGHPAKAVAITIPKDIGCAPETFDLWYDSTPCGASSPCNRWASYIGETNRVWIVEVDGTYVWIEAETYEGAGPEITNEIQGMIDSIQFK